MDFIVKFRDRVGTLKNFLSNENFKACSNLSTDLIRASEFAGFSEGIFVGEIFEAIFTNFRQMAMRFELDKNDVAKIQEVTIPVIDFVQSNFPLNSKDKRATLFELLLKARCTATEIQIMYFREKPLKKPPRSYPSSVEIEEIEG